MLLLDHVAVIVLLLLAVVGVASRGVIGRKGAEIVVIQTTTDAAGLRRDDVVVVVVGADGARVGRGDGRIVVAVMARLLVRLNRHVHRRHGRQLVTLLVQLLLLLLLLMEVVVVVVVVRFHRTGVAADVGRRVLWRHAIPIYKQRN